MRKLVLLFAAWACLFGAGPKKPGHLKPCSGCFHKAGRPKLPPRKGHR